MAFNNGIQDSNGASRLKFLIAYGLIPLQERIRWDDAEPNNYPEYAQNAAVTGKLPYLIGADASNQTQLNNPNGVKAFGFALTQLATPTAPTITTGGTAGVTSYSYKIVAKSGAGVSLGSTPASAAGSTSTGNATLSATNFNIITWSSVVGAASYDVYRTVGGAAQGLIANVLATINVTSSTGAQPATYVLNDTGLVADGTTAPTTNTTGVLATAALQGDINLVALSTPVNVVVTPNGTVGVTSYSYKVVARSTIGTTAASAAGSTTTGNATLSASNFNAVTWNAVPGAVSYDVYRTVGGATQGKIGNVLAGTTVLNDTGLAGDSSTAPTTNTTGALVAGQITDKGAATLYQAPNYIATETGANNAIAGALVDAQGNNVAQAAGLRVIVKLAHTLQAGANTFALNGASAVSIKSHFNVANNIATAYAATGVIDLLFDGTEYVDMSL